MSGIALAAAASIGLVAARKININRYSLHALYRNRLIRAFLGASRTRRADNFTGFDPEDNPRVSDLWSAPDPRLLEKLGILTTINGLDARNNPIDALLSKFGTACSTEPPLDTRPCPIESDLLAFLRGLPANQQVIAKELGALGASCHKTSYRLDCVYERQVHYVGWVAGHDGPAGISDDFFRITFRIMGKDGALGYGLEFRRLGPKQK